MYTGLFLPIWGKPNFFFSLEFFFQIFESCESYSVKNYFRKTVMLSF